MDGENNGKVYEQMGWFGGKTHHFRTHPNGMILQDGRTNLAIPMIYQAAKLPLLVDDADADAGGRWTTAGRATGKPQGWGCSLWRDMGPGGPAPIFQWPKING